MDVRVHLGAAVLEKFTHVLKIRLNRACVPIQRRVRCAREICSNPCRILVEDKNGKNVAEEHSRENQPDAPKKKQAARSETWKVFTCGRIEI